MPACTTFGVVEQVAGGLLLLLLSLDVFMTVLYARIGSGIVSRRLGRVVWRIFRLIAGRETGPRGKILRFCGPAILVLLVVVWGMMLAVGTALIIYPELGKAVRTSQGTTPTDFLSALYAGGTSVAITGSSDFIPETSAFRMMFLFNSLLGVSVLSLTLTYIMQIYSALQRRNALALNFYLLSQRTADAAEILATLGPQGRFDLGYTVLAPIASEAVSVKESHHFYPVMFYFRFEKPFYSVSAYTMLAFDALALIESALNDKQCGWMKHAAAVVQLRESSFLLVAILEEAFLSAGKAEPVQPDVETAERWRMRYRAALERLRAAGIETAEDEKAGAERYVELRTKWDHPIRRLAPFMLHSMEEIDPVGSHPERFLAG